MSLIQAVDRDLAGDLYKAISGLGKSCLISFWPLEISGLSYSWVMCDDEDLWKIILSKNSCFSRLSWGWHPKDWVYLLQEVLSTATWMTLAFSAKTSLNLRCFPLSDIFLNSWCFMRPAFILTKLNQVKIDFVHWSTDWGGWWFIHSEG